MRLNNAGASFALNFIGASNCVIMLTDFHIIHSNYDFSLLQMKVVYFSVMLYIYIDALKFLFNSIVIKQF
jgi:hypothetical protein